MAQLLSAARTPGLQPRPMHAGSSFLTLIPYIAMSLMTPFVGKVADGLVAKGWTLTNVRKLVQVGHLLLCLPVRGVPV